MASSDIANAIIIIVIFAIMQLTITISIGIARIKNNWEEYKCNPAVIPFAGVFGHDPVETFNQCVLTSQTNFMSTFLDPIYSSIGSLIESGNIMRDMFQFLKIGLNSNQLATFNLAEKIGNRVKKLITALNTMFININDVFGKLSTTVTIFFYIVQTIIETAKAMWVELPGTVIKILIPGV